MQDMYRIPDAALPQLRSEIERLNRAAAKVGGAPITLEVVETERHAQPDGSVALIHIVALHGERPKIAGWEFLATLQWLEDECVIFSVPGAVDEADLASYHGQMPLCEHCGTHRRRNKTYVLRRIADGTLRQVGSSCLVDFTGHADPHDIARAAELWGVIGQVCRQAEAWDDGDGRTHRRRYYPVALLLAYTIAAIREHGWCSRSAAKQAHRLATADRVILALEDKHDPLHEIVSDADRARAASIIEWVVGWDPIIHEGEYEQNAAAAVRAEVVPLSCVGLIAPLVTMHEREEARRAFLNSVNNAHVGTVGAKITVDVTVDRCVPLKGQYGMSYLFAMRDGEGHQLVWIASKNALEVGVSYKLTGTVKGHTQYAGQKETVLTRCKVSTAPAAQQPQHAASVLSD